MTVQLYQCKHCHWQYKSPVRLTDPPLHTCKGKALQPTVLMSNGHQHDR